MATLNSKKNIVTAKPKAAKKSVAKTSTKSLAVVSAAPTMISTGVIVKPRVTEKASQLSGNGDRMVYVFEVTASANKQNIKAAIQALYKVVPEKVAVLRVPSKKSFVRGRVSKGKTGRKAYVYLKKGEKIEII
ncbi:MAG: 50S ribosomal protein L23 [Patescibacteria group bacterium]